MGMTHAGAVKWLALMNLVFIILAIVLKALPDQVMIPLLVLLCLLISFVLKWKEPASDNPTHDA
jgi:hypothetical protein